MDNLSNTPYLLALQTINCLGPLRLKLIIDYFKDPKLAWEADTKELVSLGIPKSVVELLDRVRKDFHPIKYVEYLKTNNIKWVTIFDENYPKSLKEIYDPPIVLYYKGEFLPSDEKAIAVVGTRKVTGYGRTVTEQFSQELATSGFTVISGLARGVDSVAHWAAIEGNGRTIAVLGGGLNKIYPPENQRLAEKIIQGHGAVVSEFPPDYPSLPGNFPARNRIISGLSKAVLVTEAAPDSGSLITARLALEQGRDVFAVPGPITSQLSKGPAELIKEGATIIFEPNDIFEELGLPNNPISTSSASLVNLTDQEKQILEALTENKHIDEVCRELKVKASLVSAVLLKMEILGLVRNLGGGIYSKI